MLLIPAIDIQDGKCVRLRQGNMDHATVYGDDPMEMANRWIESGAQRLHLVDLDGARDGTSRNESVIRSIAHEFPNIEIQVGGGIRNADTVQRYLEYGIDFVILGTKAVTTPHFINDLCMEFPGHIIVGLDAKDGHVATEGWSKLSHLHVIELAQRFENDGVDAIIYTDISRDGMLSGPNIHSTVELAQAIHIPVIASGGINNIEDIQNLWAIQDEGVIGAVIGRALYEGTLDFAEALKITQTHDNS